MTHRLAAITASLTTLLKSSRAMPEDALSRLNYRERKTRIRAAAACDTLRDVVDNIVIRVAVISEQKELEEIQRRAGLANPGDREALLAHPDAIEMPLEQIASGDVFTLKTRGVLAGCAALKSRPDGDTELDGLFVDPTVQRRGFGRLLVDHCAKIARLRGSKHLCVIGNPHAEAFYLACGFEQTGTTETRFGPGLLMRRIL